MLQYFPNITGSLQVTGSVSVSGSITATGGIIVSGSIASASYSSNSELLDNLDSTAFVFTSSFNTYSSSMSTRTTTLENASSSLNTASGSFSTRVTTIESKYATTGSNIFTGAQTVCANITSTGTIIAQTLNVQQVTSSIVYSSGSNIFGCQLTDTQQFTGSMFITGSTLNVNGGAICATRNMCIGGMGIVASCLGIGTSSPSYTLDVSGQVRINSTYPQLTISGSDALITMYDTFQPYAYSIGVGYNKNYAFEIIDRGVSGASNNTVLIVTGSNIGIGTTSPIEKLHVNGNVYIASSIVYGATSYSDAAVDKGMSFSGTNLQLNNSGERMRITSGGNVGIGTCSPNATLHVYKDTGTSVNAIVRLRSTNATARTTRLQFEDYNGTLADGLIDFIIPTAGSATNARLDLGVDSTIISLVRGGNVGIGTTCPSTALDVYSAAGDIITVRKSNCIPAIAWQGTTYKSVIEGGDNFIFYTANAARMCITSGGITCFQNTVCAPTVVSNQISTGTQPPRSSAALYAYDGKAPAFFQNGSQGSYMFGKNVTGFNNAPLTPLFVVCDMGGNTGIFAKVSILGASATGANMWEDTGYAWFVYTGYTYRCSGYCIFNTVQPANGHTVGTLCWGGTATTAPYLQYCQGNNNYITEMIDVKVVVRDSANVYFCLNSIATG